MTEPLDIVQRIHSTRPYSQSLLGSGALAAGVEWWAAGPPEHLPWAGAWHGPDGIRQFFERLGALMDYRAFDTIEYIAQADSVVTIISASGLAIPTGKPFASEIVRIYTFEHAHIVRIRNYYDTYKYVQSLQP